MATLNFYEGQKITKIAKELDSYIVCFLSDETYIDTRKTKICDKSDDSELLDEKDVFILSNDTHFAKITIYTNESKKKEYFAFCDLLPPLN